MKNVTEYRDYSRVMLNTRSCPCAFEGCPNGPRHNIPMYSFPNDPQFKSLWEDFAAISRTKDTKRLRSARICLFHFREDQFSFTTLQKYKFGISDRPSLKKTAVPTTVKEEDMARLWASWSSVERRKWKRVMKKLEKAADTNAQGDLQLDQLSEDVRMPFGQRDPPLSKEALTALPTSAAGLNSESVIEVNGKNFVLSVSDSLSLEPEKQRQDPFMHSSHMLRCLAVLHKEVQSRQEPPLFNLFKETRPSQRVRPKLLSKASGISAHMSPACHDQHQHQSSEDLDDLSTTTVMPTTVDAFVANHSGRGISPSPSSDCIERKDGVTVCRPPSTGLNVVGSGGLADSAQRGKTIQSFPTDTEQQCVDVDSAVDRHVRSDHTYHKPFPNWSHQIRKVKFGTSEEMHENKEFLIGAEQKENGGVDVKKRGFVTTSDCLVTITHKSTNKAACRPKVRRRKQLLTGREDIDTSSDGGLRESEREGEFCHHDEALDEQDDGDGEGWEEVLEEEMEEAEYEEEEDNGDSDDDSEVSDDDPDDSDYNPFDDMNIKAGTRKRKRQKEMIEGELSSSDSADSDEQPSEEDPDASIEQKKEVHRCMGHPQLRGVDWRKNRLKKYLPLTKHFRCKMCFKCINTVEEFDAHVKEMHQDQAERFFSGIESILEKSKQEYVKRKVEEIEKRRHLKGEALRRMEKKRKTKSAVKTEYAQRGTKRRSLRIRSKIMKASTGGSNVKCEDLFVNDVSHIIKTTARIEEGNGQMEVISQDIQNSDLRLPCEQRWIGKSAVNTETWLGEELLVTCRVMGKDLSQMAKIYGKCNALVDTSYGSQHARGKLIGNLTADENEKVSIGSGDASGDGLPKDLNTTGNFLDVNAEVCISDAEAEDRLLEDGSEDCGHEQEIGFNARDVAVQIEIGVGVEKIESSLPDEGTGHQGSMGSESGMISGLQDVRDGLKERQEFDSREILGRHEVFDNKEDGEHPGKPGESGTECAEIEEMGTRTVECVGTESEDLQICPKPLQR